MTEADEIDTHVRSQKLSGAMAHNEGWQCFHNISRESESTLADINATLGSLRQWRKQRRAAHTPRRDEDAPAVRGALSAKTPSIAPSETSNATNSALDIDNSFCGPVIQSKKANDKVADKEDPLLVLWQVCTAQVLRRHELFFVLSPFDVSSAT